MEINIAFRKISTKQWKIVFCSCLFWWRDRKNDGVLLVIILRITCSNQAPFQYTAFFSKNKKKTIHSKSAMSRAEIKCLYSSYLFRQFNNKNHPVVQVYKKKNESLHLSLFVNFAKQTDIFALAFCTNSREEKCTIFLTF